MSEVAFLIGRKVVEVQVDPRRGARIIFELSDKPEPALYADIGLSAYEDRDGHSRPLSEMVGVVVSETSTEGGTLRLSFADRRTLRCTPHPDYEAWQVVGGTPQNLVVCLPGDGELAVCDSSHVPSAEEAEELIDHLNEITGSDLRVREVTETGGILVEPGSSNQDDSLETDAH